MRKKLLLRIAVLLFCMVAIYTEPVHAANKTQIYAALGSQIQSFKVSKGKLFLQAKEIEKWKYGTGYIVDHTQMLDTDKIQFKVSKTCKYTYSFAGDADKIQRGNETYASIKELVNNCINDEDDIGYMQLRIYVKNKKVIRVDVQTE